MTVLSLQPITQTFAAAEVTGHLHAVDLASGQEIGHAADAPVVLASVFKIPVLVEMYRQVDAGELDPAEPVTVPTEGRTLGPFGLSVMRDPVTMSWQDLAWLMMSISDNAATDIICDRVEIERVNTTLRALGLVDTVVIGSCRDLFDTIAVDLGVDESAVDDIDLTDPAVVDRLRAIDPVATSRTTPRDMTRLLSLIWSDAAASPASCEEMRRILGQQVWPHRLAAGFPDDAVRTCGKTGSLPRWRNEAGVVEYADGGQYAVAVFTRSTSTAMKNPAADAAIGQAARVAVDTLRSVEGAVR